MADSIALPSNLQKLLQIGFEAFLNQNRNILQHSQNKQTGDR